MNPIPVEEILFTYFFIFFEIHSCSYIFIIIIRLLDYHCSNSPVEVCILSPFLVTTSGILTLVVRYEVNTSRRNSSYINFETGSCSYIFIIIIKLLDYHCSNSPVEICIFESCLGRYFWNFHCRLYFIKPMSVAEILIIFVMKLLRTYYSRIIYLI